MEQFEHTMPIEQLLEKLGVPKVTSGISDLQLIERLSRDGYNILPKTKLSSTIFLTLQENLHFLLYCIILTSLLIALTEKGPSVSLAHLSIIAFTFICYMFNLFSIEKPKIPKFGTLIAVIRNGKSNIIDSKFLVKGDIVEIEQSMVSPADIRLIKVNNMLINGSVLLGKEGIRMANAAGTGDIMTSPNMVLQGFTVETGKGIGVVLNTGKNTVLANCKIESVTITGFEIVFSFILFTVWVAIVAWNHYQYRIQAYQGLITLCLVFTKFPSFIKQGRSISLLTISHLMISHQVYPKTVKSYAELMKTKFLVYDLRDALITTKKEIKRVYVEDRLHSVSQLGKQQDYLDMLKLTNFVVYKEPEVEKKDEAVPLEEWDPRPKEVEYEHPIEVTLREFISSQGLSKPDVQEHFKIPLTSKNRNSLLVITPKDSLPLAILLGEAQETLKNCKFMQVNGRKSELPIKTLTSLCEDLALEGNLCIGLAYSQIDPELIKSGVELKPEVFEFSFLGFFVVKEYTENCQEALVLAHELGITPIGIGRSNKNYLLNVAYSANLINDPPVEYKENLGKGQNVIFTPLQIIKDYKVAEGLNVFVPNISVFDTSFLLNSMKTEPVLYVGNNHVALQVSNVSASFITSSKDIKETSNFILLSNTPLVDVFRCIKALRLFGSQDFFFMLESIGCLVPATTYFIILALSGLEISSLGILLIDLGLPLSLQFLWVGYPRIGYCNPLYYWILVTISSFYNYYVLFNRGESQSFCNFAFFASVFILWICKVAWLQVWNWGKCKTAWGFAYSLITIKLLFLYLLGAIRFVAIQNKLQVASITELLPGILIFFISMPVLYMLNR